MEGDGDTLRPLTQPPQRTRTLSPKCSLNGGDAKNDETVSPVTPAVTARSIQLSKEIVEKHVKVVENEMRAGSLELEHFIQIPTAVQTATLSRIRVLDISNNRLQVSVAASGI